MKQYGTASVYGSDGTIQIDGAAAIAAFPGSAEIESNIQLDEFKDGSSEFIGGRTFDHREICDLVIVPKKTAASGSKNDAMKATKFPPAPCKITLVLPDTDTAGGHSANEIGHGGDYMYWGGARRTVVDGRWGFRLRCWRSLTSPLTTAQLLTEAT